ncbi:hypothetical protein EDD86DRAFT_247013 [Gorgonomyces haynaldii]|nr:hypothetical protein EDD86DRAFT_247013 [Gorgonomyces haynaldii]
MLSLCIAFLLIMIGAEETKKSRPYKEQTCAVKSATFTPEVTKTKEVSVVYRRKTLCDTQRHDKENVNVRTPLSATKSPKKNKLRQTKSIDPIYSFKDMNFVVDDLERGHVKQKALIEDEVDPTLAEINDKPLPPPVERKVVTPHHLPTDDSPQSSPTPGAPSRSALYMDRMEDFEKELLSAERYDLKNVISAWENDFAREESFFAKFFGERPDSPPVAEAPVDPVDDGIRAIVSAEHHLTRKTFYAAVQFIDITLVQWQNMTSSAFQLVAVACLHLASKCYETYASPLVNLLEFVRDGLTTDFDFMWPSAFDFFSRSFQMLALICPDDYEKNQELDFPPEISNLHCESADHYMFPKCHPNTFANAVSVMDQAITFPEFKKFKPSSMKAKNDTYYE